MRAAEAGNENCSWTRRVEERASSDRNWLLAATESSFARGRRHRPARREGQCCGGEPVRDFRRYWTRCRCSPQPWLPSANWRELRKETEERRCRLIPSRAQHQTRRAQRRSGRECRVGPQAIGGWDSSGPLPTMSSRAFVTQHTRFERRPVNRVGRPFSGRRTQTTPMTRLAFSRPGRRRRASG